MDFLTGIFDYGTSFGVDLSSLAVGVVATVSHVLSSFWSTLSGDLLFAVQGTNDCDRCPGSSFTSVGAAWGSIGYATQADLLWQLRVTSFHHWAVLLYVLAAAGGIIGAAMGMPPKTYLWFFIGPGLFWWLIGATEDVDGVQWAVAGKPQKQSVVWRDAEVGLQNSNLFSRENLKAFRDKKPEVQDKMRVANGFLYVDTLFSATSQALIGWTGIWKATGRGGSDTNLARNEKEEGPWFIMANNKWGMMENITSAYARNADVRDALVTFMASECGDKFKQILDSSSYMAAGQLKRGIFPKTVFKLDGDPNLNGASENFSVPQYREKVKAMDTTVTKTPASLVRLLEDQKSKTSFGKFSESLGGGGGAGGGGGQLKYKKNHRDGMIVCSEYLWVIVQALRWEAGHAYWQLMRAAPLGPDYKQIMHSLYNGWNIRKEPNGNMATTEEMHHLTRNLLFIHLLRNELLFAPQLADTKYSPAEQSRSYGEAYARQVGAKSKATELIQWALLMPHLQGILYFLLVAAYPLAALLVLVPNWYKSMFTWMSFLAWIKLWDVGFAIVQMLERTVWAMMGNNTHIEFMSRRILQMAEWESIGAQCPSGGGIEKLDGTLDGLKELCAVPVVCASDSSDLGCGGGLSGVDTPGNTNYAVLDQALMLGAGSELDLANAYYLYIMAGLYFAVPAVAGQMVLGAKAGAAGMVQNMIGGISGEVGKAAVTGHQGVLSNIASTNSAVVGQTAIAKNHRTTPFASQALQMANASLDSGMDGDFAGSTKQGWSTGNQALGLRNQDYGTGLKRMRSYYDTIANFGPVVTGKAGDVRGGVEPGAQVAKAPSGVLGRVGAGISAVGEAVVWQRANRFQTHLEHDAILRGMNTLAKGSDMDWNMFQLKQQGQGLGEGARRLNGYAQGTAAQASWDARNDLALGTVGMASVIGNVQSGAMSPGAKPADFDYLAQGGFLGGGTRQASMYPGTNFIFDSAQRGAWGKRNLGSSYNMGLWDAGMREHRSNGNNVGEWDSVMPFLRVGADGFMGGPAKWEADVDGARSSSPFSRQPGRNLPTK